MEKKKDENSFYKLIMMIAIPITLQSLLQSSLTIVDQFMVGQLGEDCIATLALSNKFYNIYLYIVLALTGGIGIFISQFWGKKDVKSIIKTLKIPFAFGGGAMIIFTAAAFVFSNQILSMLTNDAEVITRGAEIQKIYFLSVLPVLITNIYSTLLRSTYNVKWPMITGFGSIIMNTLLNYVLIFGKLGFAPMGIEGAAIATVISRWLEAAALMIVVHVFNKTLSFNIISVFKGKLEKSFLLRCAKSIWPLLALNLVFISADTLYSSIYGNMGTQDMAAMSIMYPIQGFSIGLFNGLSSATAIILGNKIGSKEIDTAEQYAKRILKLTTAFTIVISALLVLASKLYLSFYQVSQTVYDNAQKLIVVSAIFLCVRVLNMVIGQGIIQSGGNTSYVLFLDIIGMWCIGLPFAYLGAFIFNLPIYAVYFLVSLEEVLRLILGLRKVLTKQWANDLISDIKV